jgi:hypothetical protein
MPSMANSTSPGLTMIGSKSGFSAISDLAAAAFQALDGDFLVEPGDDDLAVANLGGFMHGKQVAVEDAGIDHRQAAHLEQEIGRG